MIILNCATRPKHRLSDINFKNLELICDSLTLYIIKCIYTGEDTTPIHHKQHPIYLHTTWLQEQPLYKHSTALHNINNTIATGFNQNKPAERTIRVALDMSKEFDIVNIHTLTHKLRQTNIPHTIIKFIANFIKGRKAYTTLRNRISTQRQFKNDVPQGGVLSPTLQYTHLTLQHHSHQ